jgi:hypothetical protein
MYMLLESIGLVADLHGYTPGQVSVRSSPFAVFLTESSSSDWPGLLVHLPRCSHWPDH